MDKGSDPKQLANLCAMLQEEIARQDQVHKNIHEQLQDSDVEGPESLYDRSGTPVYQLVQGGSPTRYVSTGNTPPSIFMVEKLTEVPVSPRRRLADELRSRSHSPLTPRSPAKTPPRLHPDLSDAIIRQSPQDVKQPHHPTELRAAMLKLPKPRQPTPTNSSIAGDTQPTDDDNTDNFSSSTFRPTGLPHFPLYHRSPSSPSPSPTTADNNTPPLSAYRHTTSSPSSTPVRDLVAPIVNIPVSAKSEVRGNRSPVTSKTTVMLPDRFDRARAVRALYEFFDDRKKGYVDNSDMQQFLKRYNLSTVNPRTGPDATTSATPLDVDRKLDFSKFDKMFDNCSLDSVVSEEVEHGLRMLWDWSDVDRSGRLTDDERLRFMLKLGLTMISWTDRDRDGEMNFDEFWRMIIELPVSDRSSVFSAAAILGRYGILPTHQEIITTPTPSPAGQFKHLSQHFSSPLTSPPIQTPSPASDVDRLAEESRRQNSKLAEIEEALQQSAKVVSGWKPVRNISPERPQRLHSVANTHTVDHLFDPTPTAPSAQTDDKPARVPHTPLPSGMSTGGGPPSSAPPIRPPSQRSSSPLPRLPLDSTLHSTNTSNIEPSNISSIRAKIWGSSPKEGDRSPRFGDSPRINNMSLSSSLVGQKIMTNRTSSHPPQPQLSGSDPSEPTVAYQRNKAAAHAAPHAVVVKLSPSSESGVSQSSTTTSTSQSILTTPNKNNTTLVSSITPNTTTAEETDVPTTDKETVPPKVVKKSPTLLPPSSPPPIIRREQPLRQTTTTTTAILLSQSATDTSMSSSSSDNLPKKTTRTINSMDYRLSKLEQQIQDMSPEKKHAISTGKQVNTNIGTQTPPTSPSEEGRSMSPSTPPRPELQHPLPHPFYQSPPHVGHHNKSSDWRDPEDDSEYVLSTTSGGSPVSPSLITDNDTLLIPSPGGVLFYQPPAAAHPPLNSPDRIPLDRTSSPSSRGDSGGNVMNVVRTSSPSSPRKSSNRSRSNSPIITLGPLAASPQKGRMYSMNLFNDTGGTNTTVLYHNSSQPQPRPKSPPREKRPWVPSSSTPASFGPYLGGYGNREGSDDESGLMYSPPFNHSVNQSSSTNRSRGSITPTGSRTSPPGRGNISPPIQRHTSPVAQPQRRRPSPTAQRPVQSHSRQTSPHRRTSVGTGVQRGRKANTPTTQAHTNRNHSNEPPRQRSKSAGITSNRPYHRLQHVPSLQAPQPHISPPHVPTNEQRKIEQERAKKALQALREETRALQGGNSRKERPDNVTPTHQPVHTPTATFNSPPVPMGGNSRSTTPTGGHRGRSHSGGPTVNTRRTPVSAQKRASRGLTTSISPARRPKNISSSSTPTPEDPAFQYHPTHIPVVHPPKNPKNVPKPSAAAKVEVDSNSSISEESDTEVKARQKMQRERLLAERAKDRERRYLEARKTKHQELEAIYKEQEDAEKQREVEKQAKLKARAAAFQQDRQRVQSQKQRHQTPPMVVNSQPPATSNRGHRSSPVQLPPHRRTQPHQHVKHHPQRYHQDPHDDGLSPVNSSPSEPPTMRSPPPAVIPPVTNNSNRTPVHGNVSNSSNPATENSFLTESEHRHHHPHDEEPYTDPDKQNVDGPNHNNDNALSYPSTVTLSSSTSSHSPTPEDTEHEVTDEQYYQHADPFSSPLSRRDHDHGFYQKPPKKTSSPSSSRQHSPRDSHQAAVRQHANVHAANVNKLKEEERNRAPEERKHRPTQSLPTKPPKRYSPDPSVHNNPPLRPPKRNEPPTAGYNEERNTTPPRQPQSKNLSPREKYSVGDIPPPKHTNSPTHSENTQYSTNTNKTGNTNSPIKGSGWTRGMQRPVRDGMVDDNGVAWVPPDSPPPASGDLFGNNARVVKTKLPQPSTSDTSSSSAMEVNATVEPKPRGRSGSQTTKSSSSSSSSSSSRSRSSSHSCISARFTNHQPLRSAPNSGSSGSSGSSSEAQPLPSEDQTPQCTTQVAIPTKNGVRNSTTNSSSSASIPKNTRETKTSTIPDDDPPPTVVAGSVEIPTIPTTKENNDTKTLTPDENPWVAVAVVPKRETSTDVTESKMSPRAGGGAVGATKGAISPRNSPEAGNQSPSRTYTQMGTELLVKMWEMFTGSESGSPSNADKKLDSPSSVDEPQRVSPRSPVQSDVGEYSEPKVGTKAGGSASLSSPPVVIAGGGGGATSSLPSKSGSSSSHQHIGTGAVSSSSSAASSPAPLTKFSLAQLQQAADISFRKMSQSSTSGTGGVRSRRSSKNSTSSASRPSHLSSTHSHNTPTVAPTGRKHVPSASSSVSSLPSALSTPALAGSYSSTPNHPNPSSSAFQPYAGMSRSNSGVNVHSVVPQPRSQIADTHHQPPNIPAAPPTRQDAAPHDLRSVTPLDPSPPSPLSPNTLKNPNNSTLSKVSDQVVSSHSSHSKSTHSSTPASSVSSLSYASSHPTYSTLTSPTTQSKPLHMSTVDLLAPDPMSPPAQPVLSDSDTSSSSIDSNAQSTHSKDIPRTKLLQHRRDKRKVSIFYV